MATPTLLILLALHFIMALVPMAFDVGNDEDCDRENFACAGNPVNADLGIPTEEEEDIPEQNVSIWNKFLGGVQNVGSAVWGGAKFMYSILWQFFTFDYDWLESEFQIGQYGVWVFRGILGIIQAVTMLRLFSGLIGRNV